MKKKAKFKLVINVALSFGVLAVFTQVFAVEVCYETVVTTSRGTFLDKECFDNGVYDLPASGGPTQGTPVPPGGGAPAGGGSGDGTNQNGIALSDKEKCQISHFSPVQDKHGVNRKFKWAYHDAANNMYVSSHQYPSLPAGWNYVFGSTDNSMTPASYIYNRQHQYQSWPQAWTYRSIETGLPGSIPPPFTVDETNLMIDVHEIAHQNGFSDEDQANGAAADALKNLRNDHTGACQ